MKGRNILIMLLIVVLIAALGGYLYINTQSSDSGTSESTENILVEINGEMVTVPAENGGGGDGAVLSETATPLPPMVDVVVSNQNLPRGYYITEADIDPNVPFPNVILESRLSANVNSNVVTDLREVVGKFVRSDISQGQTFTADILADDPRVAGTEKFGPSSLIPEGQVAAALPYSRLASVAYGISEGDYIDILLTFNFYQIDEEFQTYLQNAAVFYLEDTTATEGDTVVARPDIMVVPSYGRFEQLPTGDIAHVFPSEYQRPVVVSMILQKAKVIQVGDWMPTEGVKVPTPTPVPVEGEPTATPAGAQQPTPTPPPPDVVLLALSPQQQLLLKYAIESDVDIDYALRQPNDRQLYTVDAVDLNYILDRFNIEPQTFNYTVDSPYGTPEPTAESGESGGGGSG